MPQLSFILWMPSVIIMLFGLYIVIAVFRIQKITYIKDQ